jgi:GNAT superfamily N-acetyltransferase
VSELVPEGPERLTQEHDTSAFDCGKPALNDWLKRYALVNQQNHSAVTYVIHEENRVLAYYSVATSSVAVDESPERMSKGLAKHPVPVILLARLAVELRFQGQKMGTMMLKDALVKAQAVAEQVGSRALVVDAIDDDACRFYEAFGFEPFKLNPRRLMLLIKDSEKTIRDL